ncbi:hypothetical protein HU200_053157 [Digitaria exilis]|uniref:Uncharacterized protein n=1 Tax=Digitaria exilis TaxID=1010633 RepID=A0A835AMJ6_9POAL|nr:hypothetical protein HU200_053157 [Digitaria exilis]CAB3459784.1 unnamed protein product [Digitaria exilis]
MLRRAASTLSGHAAAWLRPLPRRPAAPLPGQLLLGWSHHPRAQLQPRRVLLDLGGARGYRRMARRLPPARPDGYSTSEGEVEEEDPDAREWEETPEPAAAGEEDGDDSEEVEGYMLDFSSFPDGDDEGGEEGAEEEGKK